MVDWILSVLVSRFFGNPLVTGWSPVAVLILEYAFFVGLFTQTPGMWIAQIRCVRVDGGAAIGIPRAFLRGLLLSLVIPGMIMDERRRGLHDRAVGSIVVEARRGESRRG
jgi:uncharacterized RDD family membrane protein YckC